MNCPGLVLVVLAVVLALSRTLVADDVPRPYRLEGGLPEGRAGSELDAALDDSEK